MIVWTRTSHHRRQMACRPLTSLNLFLNHLSRLLLRNPHSNFTIKSYVVHLKDFIFSQSTVRDFNVVLLGQIRDSVLHKAWSNQRLILKPVSDSKNVCITSTRKAMKHWCISRAMSKQRSRRSPIRMIRVQTSYLVAIFNIKAVFF